MTDIRITGAGFEEMARIYLRRELKNTPMNIVDCRRQGHADIHVVNKYDPSQLIAAFEVKGSTKGSATWYGAVNADRRFHESSHGQCRHQDVVYEAYGVPLWYMAFYTEDNFSFLFEPERIASTLMQGTRESTLSVNARLRDLSAFYIERNL